MFRLKQTSAPAAEPVTVAEAKLHCRVDETADDALIGTLITAARLYCESFTRRAFVTQTWVAYMDAFPTQQDFIYLPKPPLASVTGITYYDTAGTLQTWAASNYIVDAQQTTPGRVSCAYNVSWPLTQPRSNAVTITFTAGYGAYTATPDSIKAAIKLLVGHWYENREGVVTGTIATQLPLAVESLLWSERVLEAPTYTLDE